MDVAAPEKTSLFGLVRDLTAETKTFMRQEIQLAKTEISENISMMGRNTASLAVGGFVAYAGVIVLLIGLGALVAYAFASGGMDPFLAAFLGMAIIGIIIAGIGSAFIFKALKSFSKESIAPKRTLHTLQELKTRDATETIHPEPQPEEKLSSAKLQSQVEITERRMGETLDELGRRLNPRHINKRVKQRLAEKPYQAGLVAILAGFFGGRWVRRKFQRT